MIHWPFETSSYLLGEGRRVLGCERHLRVVLAGPKFEIEAVSVPGWGNELFCTKVPTKIFVAPAEPGTLHGGGVIVGGKYILLSPSLVVSSSLSLNSTCSLRAHWPICLSLSPSPSTVFVLYYCLRGLSIHSPITQVNITVLIKAVVCCYVNWNMRSPLKPETKHSSCLYVWGGLFYRIG